MARCPFAKWDRVPGAEPSITPRTVIFHTMVLNGGLYNCDAYFRSGNSGGIESHFGVGGKWGADAVHNLDGAIWQWRDTEEQADANRQANDFAVSIETADNAPRFCSDIEPWTPAQVESLVRLGRWLRRTHNIPARICRTPTDAGFGWHAMWDNTQFEFADGTTPWTPVRGKECPCPRRVAQLKNTILPRIFAATDPTDSGVDMPLDADDKTWIEGRLDVHEENLKLRLSQLLQRVGGRTNSVYNNTNPDFQGLIFAKDLIVPTEAEIAAAVVAALPATLAADIAAAVVAALPPGSVDLAQIETAVENVLNQARLTTAPPA